MAKTGVSPLKSTASTVPGAGGVWTTIPNLGPDFPEFRDGIGDGMDAGSADENFSNSVNSGRLFGSV